MADRAESDELQGTATNATASVDPARVFVSYASADAPVANTMIETLERCGLRCWIAPRDVTPGAQYADAIVGAINDAKAVVLVLSSSAVASSHVRREVERAASKHKPIIGFRIDAAPLSRSLEYFLGESQWIHVPPLGMSAALAKLAEAVGQESSRGNAAEQITARKRAPGVHGRTKLVAVAALVIGGGIAAAAGVHFWWPSSHKAAQPVAMVISDKSIAVLPFADMSEKQDQEYFGDGMAEEILDLLAKIPGLTVIGRTSSFQFKGKNADLRSIGTKLNAAYVLEGSVRNSGDQVRITAQLINTRTGAHEWSETYDRHIGDVLKLQDAIATMVVRELQLTVAPQELSSRALIKNAEAYDLYLRGRHALDRTDAKGLDEAVTLFQSALDRDPTFADAAAALAGAYINQVALGSLAPAAGFERARSMASSALKVNPNAVQARVSLAWIHMMYDHDWVAAERELRQAAVLAPNDVEVLKGRAELSSDIGRLDDAFAQIRAAVAQDPLDADSLQDLSTIQATRGNHREAEAAMRRALDIRPTYAYGHYNLGLILLERGDDDGALREMQQETIDDGKQQGLALALYAQGKKTAANAALAVLIKEQAQGNALDIAQVYAFRGQSDEAMDWLERAYAQKDPWLFRIKGGYMMKRLEADPRYKAFLRKMNFPE
jgi:TolB-like protein/Tfp pilus assembly protein PilF